VRLRPYRTLDDYIGGVVITFLNITERKRAEEQQVFLLHMSDALRSLVDPLEIQQVAMRMLGQHLNATRAFYFFTEPADGGNWIHIIEADYRRDPDMQSHVGRHSVKEFGIGLSDGAERGKIVAIEDVTTVPILTPTEKEKYLAIDVMAFINVPLIKDGRFIGGIGVHDSAPRLWQPEEIALIQEVAARIWAAIEQARAEAALRESEAEYRTLVETMDAGFSVCEAIRDERGTMIDYRFIQLNRALEKLTGLDPARTVGKRALEVLPGLDRWWLDTY
jgi:GAF domain-containing protein